MAKIKVGIVGGTGYTGVELLRVLARHPQVEIVAVTSRENAGMPVAKMFPNLRGAVDVAFSEPSEDALKQCAVVFFATPHGVAMSQARMLVDAGVKIVDLAADFRIKDLVEWEKWYKLKHACPDLVEEAVYGLPEMYRAQIKKARIVANPGCHATAVQLGFLPLVKNAGIDLTHLIADTKTGVSGAGRKAEVQYLFSEASDNLKAYAVAGHRHLPEIVDVLNATGNQVSLTFVPHLTPLIRGIHATLYAKLTRNMDVQDIQTLYEKHYANEPFVDALPSGSYPETRSVRGSNLCRIAVHKPQGSDIVVVLSAIDNLTKGAAGQAVQNMNLMFGFAENAGLEGIALIP